MTVVCSIKTSVFTSFVVLQYKKGKSVCILMWSILSNQMFYHQDVDVLNSRPRIFLKKWICFLKVTSWFPFSHRWMESWRPSFVMRSSRGTKRPRRTRPFPCPQPGSQRTWTPSSWSRWSRRPSRQSWLASITWLSSREARVRSTLWWLQQTASTICVAWIQPGTPGSEKSEAREEKRHSGVHGMKGKHFFFFLVWLKQTRVVTSMLLFGKWIHIETKALVVRACLCSQQLLFYFYFKRRKNTQASFIVYLFLYQNDRDPA